jgi:hypothetical protein
VESWLPLVVALPFLAAAAFVLLDFKGMVVLKWWVRLSDDVKLLYRSRPSDLSSISTEATSDWGRCSISSCKKGVGFRKI